MKATPDDVRHAYRLLLGREPDAAGLETYTRLVRDHPLRPVELAEYFLGSNEFRSRYNSEVFEVALDGFVVMVRADDSDVGKSIAQTRQWEAHVTSALRERLRPGDGFLDVGANIGYFTALGAHLVGEGGRVIALEPMDKNLQLIYATMARNGFTQVQVLPFAASDESRIVGMGTHGGSSNGEIVREWTGAEPPLYAQTRRLDDLLAGSGRVDVAKFDIEGHELHAWRGFARGLARDRPVVLTEFHPKCLRDNGGVDPRDYGAVLLDYGQVSVLHFDGRRSTCDDGDTLMRLWAAEDAALNTDGAAHLDLLVQPRS